MEDGIIITFILTVFVIAPVLLGAWMSVVMAGMLFIQRVGYRWLNDEDFAEFPDAVADFSSNQHNDLGDHQTDIFGSIS